MDTPSELQQLMDAEPSETTALLPNRNNDKRQALFDFLEAQSSAGRVYEAFIVSLIAINVVAFVVGTLFVEEYNEESWASHSTGICQRLCDALWFGNFRDNGLDDLLHLGSTSVLELFTVAVFTIEYILRLYVADMESPKYKGILGRLRYLPTFFSLVDLASTVPFYVDAFVLRHTDLASSSFLRMFRLFRMIRAEGRYDTALTMIDDVYQQQKGILLTALFLGVTTWVSVSALYYLTERRNLEMIYCPSCGDVDTTLCILDRWGMADCSQAGCYSTKDIERPCYNLYESIPMASYYALLNLFGEFPLMENHSVGGKIVGTITAVVAVAVFALPVGIIGNGFENVIEEKRAHEDDDAIVEQSGMTLGFRPYDSSTVRAKLYNLFHAVPAAPEKQDSQVVSLPSTASLMDGFINFLIVATSLSFMIDTTARVSPILRFLLDVFELSAVTFFTGEYIARVYSCVEDPKYQGNGGRLKYALGFLPIVDLLSFLPFWILATVTGQVIAPGNDTSTWTYAIKSLRLLRLFRFEKYTHAFLSFDDVISRNKDVLSITAFTAILFWIFFAAFLYITERDSLDDEMAENYKSVPHSMWITLLNLSGESPLCQYSQAGKIATGILGLFATGVFGIPIGVLGAGFEEVIEEENEDDVDELRADNQDQAVDPIVAESFEYKLYQFVNGIGSKWAEAYEICVYSFILVAVAVGIWQTVDGHGDDFEIVEDISVAFFTIEYCLRLVAAGADPLYSTGSVDSRVKYIFSFYSIVDLLAIVPFYLALALPNSVVADYADLLRMLRVIRLVKLDNKIPSITLIDDVIRLKFKALKVAFYAAVTLWTMFGALIFLCEHKDRWNDIDPVPLYSCQEDCTMLDRFQNFFDSMVYTGIHLTGDYPIITYTWPARFVNFFMVIAAVGVVSIPSGLIASGFVEIVQSKSTAHQRGRQTENAAIGDDWFDIRYRELANVPPPNSPFGPNVDRWQYAVHDFLNGTTSENGDVSPMVSKLGRMFIFCMIVLNVFAVLAESVPALDKAVGNAPGNAFDQFEAFSVAVFSIEYCLRLFCAPKSRESLYSSFVYAQTFFGIVDLMSTAPWFIQQGLISVGMLDAHGDTMQVFRCVRIFRLLQLEDFVTAFSKLDNVFRASKDVLKATGLLALIIWVGCGGLFYIFEENNPNWRQCDPSVPLTAVLPDDLPGCYDFPSTKACNETYPGLCSQKAFTNMPNSLFYTAVFLGGEWGVVDFTWPGRFVCLFLCVVGIGLYAIPVGSLFDSFGAVLGLDGEDEEEEE